MMRDCVYPVLVCGGRDHADWFFVDDCLDTLRFLYGDLMIITGSCPTGADYYAEQWAKSRQQIYVGFPAEWDKYGKRAGMKRNAEMGAMAQAKQVVVFQGGRGTLNMLSIANTLKLDDPELIIWLPEGEFWK